MPLPVTSRILSMLRLWTHWERGERREGGLKEREKEVKSRIRKREGGGGGR